MSYSVIYVLVLIVTPCLCNESFYNIEDIQPLCNNGLLYRTNNGGLKCCYGNNDYDRFCNKIICSSPDGAGMEVPMRDNNIHGLFRVCSGGLAYTQGDEMFCCRQRHLQRQCTKIACVPSMDGVDAQMNTAPIMIDGRPDFCYLPPEEGDIRCRAYIERYTFKQETGRCELFIYGGCRGTQNNFVTLSDCQAACET